MDEIKINKNKALDYLSNFEDKEEALISINKARNEIIKIHGSEAKAYIGGKSIINIDKIIRELEKL